jgi:hypothetical protein
MPKSVNEYLGLYRKRLHPAGTKPEADGWWNVRNATSAAAAATDMIDQLELAGWHVLDQMLMPGAMLEQVKNGDLGYIKGSDYSVPSHARKHCCGWIKDSAKVSKRHCSLRSKTAYRLRRTTRSGSMRRYETRPAAQRPHRPPTDSASTEAMTTSVKAAALPLGAGLEGLVHRHKTQLRPVESPAQEGYEHTSERFPMAEQRTPARSRLQQQLVTGRERARDGELAEPDQATTRFGGKHGRVVRHLLVAGRLNGQLQTLPHPSRSAGPDDERIPLLVRWKINQNRPNSVRSGVDDNRRIDDAYAVS